jgi:Holliday junction resolvasome RuvABC endonuclease subunit
VLIAIEAQQAMPKQGLVSTMHLGESFGILQGIVIGLQLPLVLVKPKQWKKTVLADTPMDKSAAINYVIQRYPKIDMNVGTRKVIYHDGIADAVCIADHAMRYMTVGGLAASAETYEDSEAENEAADAELDKENEA